MTIQSETIITLLILAPLVFSLLFFWIVMLVNPYSLWSGAAALGVVCGLGLSVLFTLFRYSERIAQNQLYMNILVLIMCAVLVFLALFPFGLAALFFIEGVRLIRKEGFSITNCLSIGFSLLILFDVFALPLLTSFSQTNFWSLLYMMLTLVVFFFSAQLAIFCLSAWINLIHLRKNQDFDQIVVLGSGVLKDRVPPLLQNRILKGIELQKKNKGAVLFLSGGQGPGEDLPEGAAMKKWALEHGADPSRTLSEEKSANTRENLLFSARLFPVPGGRTAIVTTRYHVFRALVLSKELAIPAKGFGSKTKWYFTLNAVLREFAAYLSMTRKKQVIWLLILLSPFLLVLLFTIIFH